MRFELRAADLEHEIGARDELTEPLTRTIAARDASIRQQALRIAELEQTAAAKDLEIGELRKRLDEQALRQSLVEQGLQAVYASRSWRLTAPLRKFKMWLHH
jgi:hypothetical protein